MITKVFDYVQKFHMIDAKDRIVVGLSGGADSVCLLFLLCQLKQELDFSLEAVHVHHGLRTEADAEARYAENLCNAWQVPCRIERVDVLTYQKNHHLGTEEAARILRYKIFEKEQKQNKKVALAHHKNDQAETVLFHLFRGSSLRGLRGMEPVRDQIIRPLLCVSREEIEAFLAERQIDYVIDQSNFDTTYSRNLIRHKILPLAETEICHGATEHICTSAEGICQAFHYLDTEAKKLYEAFVEDTKDGCRIKRMDITGLHPYMRAELIYRMLCACSKNRKDIQKVHVDAVSELLNKQSGRRVQLIYRMEAYLDQHYLYVQTDCKKEQSQEEEKPDISMTTRVFAYKKGMNIPAGNYTKWFDYDKIKTFPILRYRQTGDYFFCTNTAKKKLQDYMVDVKIPMAERNTVPLVADEDHILWIVGYRISEFYKVTDKTSKVMEITIEKKENEQ